jgi:aminopeptidase N
VQWRVLVARPHCLHHAPSFARPIAQRCEGAAAALCGGTTAHTAAPLHRWAPFQRQQQPLTTVTGNADQYSSSSIEARPDLGLTRLADYRPPPYRVDRVELVFHIEDTHTTVHSTLHCRPSDEHQRQHDSIVLDGGPPRDMKLVSVSLNREQLQPGTDYSIDEGSGRLRINRSSHQGGATDPLKAFMLEIKTEIAPQHNSALEGLFVSNGVLLTQCEAEGFRRITYFFDRPDVLAKFTTKIIADRTKYPVLLSNGNCVEEGGLPGNKHWTTWEDPHPKPSYLFALVAGDLLHNEAVYTTAFSKKKVRLRIYTEEENISKVHYAMQCLQRAMEWDEQKYGLEYDLSDFNIVAVNDFNMGAMENKGLNIFNSKYLLVHPKTVTDDDLLNVERVIAHEYFHNYTGNRVTLRDWFQLSLKEGLTMFREDQFVSHYHSPAVQRINQVAQLRNVQFREDSGPMAHSVRPDSYIDISNFYTSTVYDKGSDVVRMLHTLLGESTFTRGVQTYLREKDGTAATVEDFVEAMKKESQRSLDQFYRWYNQAGTPEIKVVEEAYNEKKRQYTLTLAQSAPSTPGQPAHSKQPFLVPVTMGLLGRDGRPLGARLDGSQSELTSHTLELREAQQSFVFDGVSEKPVLSLLRDFSAPIRLVQPALTREDRLILMHHDTDPFNRWESCQSLALDAILALAAAQKHQPGLPAPLADQVEPQFVEAMKPLFHIAINDQKIDQSFMARLISLPSESYVGQHMKELDVVHLHKARTAVKEAIGRECRDELYLLYRKNQLDNPLPETLTFNSKTSSDSEERSERDLKNVVLDYIMHSESHTRGREGIKLCIEQCNAPHMTDRLAALTLLAHTPHARAEAVKALDRFIKEWHTDLLLMNKWFRIQATAPLLEHTLGEVKYLTKHPHYHPHNPNNIYSLIGSFVLGNQYCFHGAPDESYAFLVAQVTLLNFSNPQLAARLLKAMEDVVRLPEHNRQVAGSQLRILLNTPGLSKEVYEVASLCHRAIEKTP